MKSRVTNKSFLIP